MVSHHHEEFVFVLRERIELRLKTPDGLQVEKLEPGDCAYFGRTSPTACARWGQARGGSARAVDRL